MCDPLRTMPKTSPNDLNPRFVKNLDALAAASPALHDVVQALITLNEVDPRIFVSTVTHAHLYAGPDYLVRIELPASGVVQLHRETKKAIFADANKRQAEEFFRAVVHLAMAHNGYKTGWADLDRAKGMLTFKGAVPGAFVKALVELVRDAAGEPEEEPAAPESAEAPASSPTD